MRIDHCPARSPRSTSSRLDGGKRRSSTVSAFSNIRTAFCVRLDKVGVETAAGRRPAMISAILLSFTDTIIPKMYHDMIHPSIEFRIMP